MKPLVYLDIAHNATGAIVIDEKRFKEILDEVYEAGYQDGFEKGKNLNYITPYWNGDHNWNIKTTLTTPTVTYDTNGHTDFKSNSPIYENLTAIKCNTANEAAIKDTLIKEGTIGVSMD